MKTRSSMTKQIVLILATILISFCMLKSTVQAEVKVVANPDAPSIYWTRLGDFPWKIIQRLDGSNVKDIISTVASIQGIALDVQGNKIYWVTEGVNRRGIDGKLTVLPKTIWRANLDGTNIQAIISPNGLVTDITLDVQGGKIYWVEPYNASMMRANLDGSHVENISISGVDFPSGIALDVQGGKMYWTARDRGNQTKIQRANLDGSNVQNLVTGLVFPKDLTIDVRGGKIYWINYTQGSIQRANLDGSNVQNLVTGLPDDGSDCTMALDVEGGKIYWNQSVGLDTKMRRANLDGSHAEDYATGMPGGCIGLTIAPSQSVSVPRRIPLPVKLEPKPDSPDSIVKIPDVKLAEPAVPATGTWVFVNKPRNLTPDNFTIGPGEFAILVPQGSQNAIKKADFKTYASYYAHDGNADLPNLARFFQNGGRIELVSHATLNPLPPDTKEPQFGDIVISEIMWGLDRSSPAKQYIELYNASAHTYTFREGNLSFRFSKASESPLPAGVFPLPPNPKAHTKVVDRVSNKRWKVPGRSGNTSENNPLISMYRTIDYTTERTPDGTLAGSWKASTGRVNLPAPSYGTPGARHLPPRPVVLVAASQRPPMYWIDAKARTLHRLVADDVETLVPTVKNATSLAVDIAGGKLYWTERIGERTGRIRGANLNGTNVRLVKDLTSVSLNIAIDPSDGKIYLTNAWGKIQRLNVDGSNFQPNLITDLDTPGNLILDVTGGKVYWTETTGTSGRIRRANLDGSSVQNVASGLTAPLSLAVAAGKVYSTSAKRLYRANLNGANRRTLETLPIAPTSIAFDPPRNSLYLTSPAGGIYRRNLNDIVYQPIVTGLVSPSNIVLGISATPPVSKGTTVPPSLVMEAAADVNQDKKVNKTDLLLVVTALGESPPANPNFDVNADGTVNIADVLLVIEDLDDPIAAAAPSFGETLTALDPAQLAMQIDILRAESDGSMKYQHAIAFFQSLLASIRPSETRLLANYPNPFNPETWIPYQLATDTSVRITIYNTQGVAIRTLELGHQWTGYYTGRDQAAYWDGRNAFGEHVASGIYFYQFETDDLSLMRKMVILK